MTAPWTARAASGQGRGRAAGGASSENRLPHWSKLRAEDARGWATQVDNDGRQDYLFTGKELDPGTQLYYFGARYYDPMASRWEGPDPALAMYMGGRPNGGMFLPRNAAVYSYAINNPIALRDPNGAFLDEAKQAFLEGKEQLAQAAGAASAAAATGAQFVTAATLGATAAGAAAVASVAAGYEGYKLYHELPAVQDAKAREEAANRAQKGVSESGAKASEAVPAAGGGGAKAEFVNANETAGMRIL